MGHTWNRIEGHECGREGVGSANGDDTKRFMFYLNQYRAQVRLSLLPPSLLSALSFPCTSYSWHGRSTPHHLSVS